MKHAASLILVAGLCACAREPATEAPSTPSATSSAAASAAPAQDASPSPSTDDAATIGSPRATPPPGGQGIAVGEPNPSAPGGFRPPVTDAPPGSGLARFDGYGDMTFGMTVAQAKAAWGGDLNGKVDGDECAYLNPKGGRAPSYFAFMFEGGRFVRYDVGNDREIAPGGGRRGMDADEIRRLYAGRVSESPHKYVDGGRYLKVKGDGGAIVFETDATGTVTAWHAGVEPQVNYIEGCS